MADKKSYHRPLVITHVVTAAEDTAGAAAIPVKVAPLPTDVFAFVAKCLHAGVEVASLGYAYDSATGLLTVADGLATALTANDVITIIGAFIK
jgi:hypothetical protein